jgi:hypothetical protein
MPDGKSLISGWSDGRIRAYGPQTGKLEYTIINAHCSAGARKGAVDTVSLSLTLSLSFLPIPLKFMPLYYFSFCISIIPKTVRIPSPVLLIQMQQCPTFTAK